VAARASEKIENVFILVNLFLSFIFIAIMVGFSRLFPTFPTGGRLFSRSRQDFFRTAYLIDINRLFILPVAFFAVISRLVRGWFYYRENLS
jgi:hypothetical protein